MLHVLREFLRVFFIMGTVLVPILYWLLGIVNLRNQNRIQGKKEQRYLVDRVGSEDPKFRL
jgi:hypothetical protein